MLSQLDIGEIMTSISIRGVEEQLANALKQQAKKTHKSVNQFVIEALRKHVGLDKQKRFTVEYNDLDHLFGRWSQEEHDLIQGKINLERKIDMELWK